MNLREALDKKKFVVTSEVQAPNEEKPEEVVSSLEMVRGRIDGVTVPEVSLEGVVGTKIKTCELLKQNHRPAHLLPINVHAIESWHPYVEEATIYSGACHGNKPIPDKDIPTVSVQALLLTHKAVDASIIRTITRILYEHRNKLMAENPRAATIELPNSGENLGIPLHLGAKSYYRREEPGFLVTYSDPLTLFLSLSMLCVTKSDMIVI